MLPTEENPWISQILVVFPSKALLIVRLFCGLNEEPLFPLFGGAYFSDLFIKYTNKL